MKILIIGCNGITDFIVSRLASSKGVTEICIAAKEKAPCDELRKKYTSAKGPRITALRVDLNNESGTRMMLSITQPDLIVNLAPAELSLAVMKLALEADADYIDRELYNWKEEDLLSEQFSLFSDFRDKNKMAVAGCGMSPALLSALVRNTLNDGLTKIDSADVFEMNMGSESPSGGNVQFIENGEAGSCDAMSVRLEGDYESFGKYTVCLMDSPVTRVFLKAVADVPNLRCFMSFVPDEKPDLSNELELLGMNSEEPVEIAPGVTISPKQFWQKYQDSLKVVKDLKGACGIGAVVNGFAGNNKKRKFVYTTSDNTMSMEKYNMPARMLFDAYTLLTGINLIISKKWDKSGVYSPTSFNAALLIEGIKDNGLGIRMKDLPLEEG